MSVAGIASQFSQLQGAKPANHIIDRELHLMSCKRDVIQTFRVCTTLRKVNTLMDDLLLICTTVCTAELMGLSPNMLMASL